MSLTSTADGVIVETDSGDRHEAGGVILATGQWIGDLGGPELQSLLSIHREVLWWFDVEDGVYDAMTEPRMPVYIWIDRTTEDLLYGFPALDGPRGGIKISGDDYSILADPDGPRTSASPEECARFYSTRRVGERMPGVSPRCLRSVVCHYTVTPDFGFIIDRHPHHERVLLVSACSGHGFKHSGGVGEAVATMLLEGRSRFDVTNFQLSRFAGVDEGVQPSHHG